MYKDTYIPPPVVAQTLQAFLRLPLDATTVQLKHVTFTHVLVRYTPINLY